MNTKSLTITNVILIIAVVILFVMQFSKGGGVAEKPVEPKEVKSDSIKIEPVDELKKFNVAYINSDTLSKYSDYINDITKDLKSKQATAEYKLQKMVKAHQKSVEEFQRDQPVMGQAEAQRKYSELMANEQKIMQEEQVLTQKYAEKEAKIMTDYVYETDGFMQRIGRELGYDYIMSYRVGGAMLYANPELDITSNVIDLLNAEYKKSKETEQPSTEK
jgi:outer membrane protein